MTRLSVTVPTYNGAKYVVLALQSILGQTFKDFELIVIDDRSDDQTPHHVASIRDPRIKLVINEQRQGLVGNWNRCIEEAQAPYVCIFHQDDLLHPTALERLINTLDNHPDVGFVFTNMHSINNNGEVIGGHWSNFLPETNTILPGQEFFRLILQRGNLVPCSSVVLRTSCFRELGGFDRRLKYTPDMEMWLRLSLHYDVAFLAEPLAYFRRHSEQESNHYIGRLEEIREVWRALQILFTDQLRYIADPERAFTIAVSHLERWTSMLAVAAVKQGRLIEAAQFGHKALFFRTARKEGFASLALVA